MFVQELLERNNLSASDLDAITGMMFKGESLESIHTHYPEMRVESIYAVCSIYCKEELNSPIELIAPGMYRERERMNSSHKEEYRVIKLRKKVLAAIEDVVQDFHHYVAEKA